MKNKKTIYFMIILVIITILITNCRNNTNEELNNYSRVELENLINKHFNEVIKSVDNLKDLLNRNEDLYYIYSLTDNDKVENEFNIKISNVYGSIEDYKFNIDEKAYKENIFDKLSIADSKYNDYTEKFFNVLNRAKEHQEEFNKLVEYYMDNLERIYNTSENKLEMIIVDNELMNQLNKIIYTQNNIVPYLTNEMLFQDLIKYYPQIGFQFYNNKISYQPEQDSNNLGDKEIYAYPIIPLDLNIWKNLGWVFLKSDTSINIIDNIENIQTDISYHSNNYNITLILDSKGSDKVYEFTGKHIYRRVAILLNDKVIMAPTIHEKIGGNGIVLSGFMTEKEAKTMASVLNPSK